MEPKLVHQAFERDARSILSVIRTEFPEARIASGAPADISGLSDVDILVFRDGATEQRVYRKMDGRDVNILITGDRERKRSLVHRAYELYALRDASPEELEFVVEAKRGGRSTEAAWSLLLLEYDPEDAYDFIVAMWRGFNGPFLLTGRM